jgi:hypothetical protein
VESRVNADLQGYSALDRRNEQNERFVVVPSAINLICGPEK